MTLEHGSPTHMDSLYGNYTQVYKGTYREWFQLILRN